MNDAWIRMTYSELREMTLGKLTQTHHTTQAILHPSISNYNPHPANAEILFHEETQAGLSIVIAHDGKGQYQAKIVGLETELPVCSGAPFEDAEDPVRCALVSLCQVTCDLVYRHLVVGEQERVIQASRMSL